MDIDISKLSTLLGVEVIPTIAVKNVGIQDLKDAIFRAKPGKRDKDLIAEMEKYRSKVNHGAEALLILEDDEEILKRYQLKPVGSRERIYRSRREYIDRVIEEVCFEINAGISFATKLSRWTLNPITGIPLLVILLYFMYQFIGVFVAQTIVDFTEGVLMGEYYLNFILGIFKGILSPESKIGTILIGEFGMLTMVPVYIIGLLLPRCWLSFLLSIMEDTGYLPRVATLTDRS